jgi:antitoxin HicB
LDYKEKLEKYLKLNYRMRVYPITTDDGTVEWGVEYPDLPGCVGGGDTKEEALKMAEDAKAAWLEIALKEGKKIPLPKDTDEKEYSGKYTLRIPKSLHRELTLAAEEEGLSLNQYTVYLLTKNHFQKIDTQNNNFKIIREIKTSENF